MDKLQKLYLSILSHLLKKQLIREFAHWKSRTPHKVLTSPKPFVDSYPKRKTHTSSSDKINKFKSLTEKSLKRLVEDLPELDVIPESNIFEELKSSLMNKAMKNDGKIKEDDQSKSTKILHRKNNSSLTSMYFNSGTRKKLMRNNEALNELAVVSSCSALNFRKDKNNPLFTISKK